MSWSSSSRPLPPTNADSGTTWKFLEEGIHDIMTKGQSKYLDYMSLYTVSYNYCTSNSVPSGIHLSQIPADLKLEQDDMTDRKLMSLDLYIKLKKYLAEHLKIVREGAESLIDDDLLRYYAEEWDKYTIGATCINRLFTVLNRHWVEPMKDARRKGIYTVYRLALVQWKQNVLDRIQSENAKLTSAMLRRIEKERNVETIDQTLLDKVIDSFMFLGIEETGSNKQSLDVYKEHFETPFIAAIENYYRQESTGLLTINSISDYLKKVEERLKEERDRTSLYLPGKTWRTLIATCEHVLVREHIGLIWEELQRLLGLLKENDDIESGEIAGTGANLTGVDLYNEITRYLVAQLKLVREGAESLFDENLLRYYAKEWDRYTTDADCINRLFTYLNRYWIQREKDVRGKGVYTLALVQWKQNFFDHLHYKNAKLAGAVLKQIEKERNGEIIGQILVKKVVNSFVSLGVDERDSNTHKLDVYKYHFETPFIAATESYYKQESTNFLSANSVSDYLKKAEERLKEEEDRVDRYLHTCTRKTLVATCEHALIREHAETMWEEFQKLLDFDKDEDLQRMYALLSRIPEGLEPLRRKFEEHVKRAGLAAVEKLVSGGDSNSEESIDPKAYVDALLEVHKKNSETVDRSFRGEAGFVASLDKACREFVNRNAATGSSSSKSPELLAKQADALLRKNNKMSEEGSLESALNQVMVIFKYIEDKDVFQNFYTNKLSKRLIHGASASDEAESSMISKLKEACGFEYSQKLQRMFTDMSLSKDLTDSFREKMAVSHPEDSDLTFTIQVLATNVWPLKSKDMNFVIPKEILPTYNRFQQYYQQKHSGRRLTWLWAYGKNELHSNYTSQKCIFMTSSFQMAVLVQYNDYDSLSFEEIQANTDICEDLLKQVLGILCKARVLLNDGEGEPYGLNMNYKSKKIRVNLNQPIKLVEKAESIEVLKDVDEDRKLALQATIVRIMKARKTMKNQELIQEVISHVSARFTPNIPDVKKAIDALFEQEYMKRVDDAHDIFAYVA